MKKFKYLKNWNEIKESNSTEESKFDYDEIYNVLGVSVNSEGIIPMSDFQDILIHYDIEEEELAEIAAKVQADVQVSKEKNDDLEFVAKEALYTCVYKKDVSLKCFEKELRANVENYYDVDIEDFDIEKMFVKLNNEQTIKEIESELENDISMVKDALKLLSEQYPTTNKLSDEDKVRFMYKPKIQDFFANHGIYLYSTPESVVSYVLKEII